ncbi:MAG TPA: hypothetical protein VIM55_07585 [Mucilaginibacter sp.]
MKLLNRILLFFTCLPLFSLAQSNYQPGYVVGLNGDTTRGYIDHREWFSNPDVISFKKEMNGESRRYTPADIKFFNINNTDAYQTYTGPVSMDLINTDRLNTGRDTTVKVTQVFLKVLQKGRYLTLYSYADDVKTRFFVSDSPGDIGELTYRIYLANDANGSEHTQVESTYLKQLNTLALKHNGYKPLDNDLISLLQRADYQKQPILHIVSRINNVTDQEFKARYDDESGAYMYVGVGGNFTSTTVDPKSGYYRAGGKNGSSVLPVIDAGVNFLLDPKTGSISIRFEFAAALAKYQSVFDSKNTPMVNTTYGYTNLAVSISPQIIYNFYNAKDLKIYAGGGVQVVSQINMSKAYKKTADGTALESSAEPFNFKRLNIPLIAKAGVVVNEKFDINAGYVFSKPVSDDYVFVLNTSSFQIGLNYRF